MEEMKENIPKELIEAFENNYNANWDDPVMRSERLAWCAAWAAKSDAQAAPQTTLAPVADELNMALARMDQRINYGLIRSSNSFSAEEARKDMAVIRAALAARQETPRAAVAAIQFALETDAGLAFLRCWNEGKFDVIRREWPEAPEAVFVGADPLHPATVI